MLSSAWLSHVPEFARSTTGERVNGMRGANVVLSRSGYCNQCADGARAVEAGETLVAPGEKTRVRERSGLLGWRSGPGPRRRGRSTSSSHARGEIRRFWE